MLEEGMATPSTIVSVTSDNLQEFQLKRMGLAQPEPTLEPVEVKEESDAVKADEENTQDEEVHETEKKGNPKLQKRFSELTKQREDARQEAAKERERAAALEARLQALEKPKEKVQEVFEKPVASQFTDAFEYAEKLAEWSAQNALNQRDKIEAEKAAKAEADKVLNTWNQRIADTKKEMADFDDVISASDVKVSDQVRDAILDSDVGPKILYHLANNPKDADKLASMSVLGALREIGRLEERLTKPAVKEEPEPEKVQVSKAPAPITPLKNASVPMDKISSDGEFSGTPAEWRALRKAGKIK